STVRARLRHTSRTPPDLSVDPGAALHRQGVLGALRAELVPVGTPSGRWTVTHITPGRASGRRTRRAGRPRSSSRGPPRGLSPAGKPRGRDRDRAAGWRRGAARDDRRSPRLGQGHGRARRRRPARRAGAHLGRGRRRRRRRDGRRSRRRGERAVARRARRAGRRLAGHRGRRGARGRQRLRRRRAARAGGVAAAGHAGAAGRAGRAAGRDVGARGRRPRARPLAGAWLPRARPRALPRPAPDDPGGPGPRHRDALPRALRGRGADEADEADEAHRARGAGAGHSRGAPMSVAVFVAVTTAVSALLWLLGAAAPGELVVAALPVSALMFVAPGIGAAVAVRVRRRSGPPDGAWPAAARRALRWAALLPAVVLAAAALDAWVGPTTPDPVPSATALVVVSL